MRHPILVITLAALFAVTLQYAYSPVEAYRVTSPDQRHTAVISYHRFRDWLPGFSSPSKEKPGAVQIIDKQNTHFGEMPIPDVQLGQQIRWWDGGARIKSIGIWRFRDRYLAYWNENQTALIESHAGAPSS